MQEFVLHVLQDVIVLLARELTSCVLLAVGLVPQPRLLVRFVYRVMFWTIARQAPKSAQLIVK